MLLHQTTPYGKNFNNLYQKNPKELEEEVMVLQMCVQCVRGRPSRGLHTSSNSAGSVGKTSASSCPSITVQLNPDRGEGGRERLGLKFYIQGALILWKQDSWSQYFP